jgi:hypothetical protein
MDKWSIGWRRVDSVASALTLLGRGAYERTMVARLAVVAMVLGSVNVARAQDFRSDSDFVGGDLQVTVTSPDATDKRIDCLSGSDCAPMNLSACTSSREPRTIEVEVARSTNISIAAGSTLVVWLEEEDDCTIVRNTPAANQSIIDEIDLTSSSPLVGSTFLFPDDLEATGVTLTTDDFLHGSSDFDGILTDICGTSGDRAVYRLCFGVDVAAAGGSGDGEVKAGEPAGWLRLLVDNEVPPEPTEIKAEGLDGTVHVSGSLDDSDDPDDLFRWKVRLREAPDGATGVPTTTPSDCDTWKDPIVETQAWGDNRTLSLDLDADNGVLYEGCALLVDEAGNEGTPSPSFYATPIDQCDFIECYPGDLDTGFCDAGGLPSLAGIVALLALRRRRVA